MLIPPTDGTPLTNIGFACPASTDRLKCSTLPKAVELLLAITWSSPLSFCRGEIEGIGACSSADYLDIIISWHGFP